MLGWLWESTYDNFFHLQLDYSHFVLGIEVTLEYNSHHYSETHQTDIGFVGVEMELLQFLKQLSQLVELSKTNTYLNAEKWNQGPTALSKCIVSFGKQ